MRSAIDSTSVLIIEGESVVAAHLASVVERLGYVVIATVGTGEQGLEVAQQTSPDVVLLDIRLAGQLDGIETARRLHTVCDAAVVFITAQSDKETVRKATASGLCGYVLKPFDELTLATQLEVAEYKHHAHSNMRKLEERWQLLLRGSPDAIWEWDIRNHTVFLSARWKAIRQYREDEIGSEEGEWVSRIHPDDVPRVMKAVSAYLSRETSEYQCEYRSRSKDGSYIWILDRGVAVWDANGPVRMVGSETDVTARKQGEEELGRAHALLNTMLTQAPVGFVFLDLQLRFVMINERLAAINGLSVADHIGKRVHEIVPSLAPTVEAVVAEMLRTGQPVKDHEFCGETALQPGATRYWNESWYPLRETNGALLGFAAIVEEITERKRADHALRNRERTQRLLAQVGELAASHSDVPGLIAAIGQCVANDLSLSRCGISTVDLQSKTITVTDDYHSSLPSLAGVYEIQRYAADQLHADGEAGRTTVFADLATHLEKTADIYGERYAPIQVRAYVNVPLHRAGQWIANFWVSHHEPRDWSQEDVQLLELIAERIWNSIEHKKAEVALRESESRFAGFMKHFPGLAWIKDAAGHYVFANDEALKAFAKSREEIYGKTDKELFAPDTAEQFARNDKSVLSSGSPVEIVETLEQQNGIHQSLVTKFPIPASGGEQVMIGGTAIDVTERVQAEEAMRRLASELEARVKERTEELVRSHERLRALATELNLAEHRERKKLASELHDHLAQLLVLARLKLGQAKQLRGLSAQGMEIVEDMEKALSEALLYTRTLVADLCPPVLYEFGLTAALKWLAERMRVHKLHVTLLNKGPAQVQLPEEHAVLLFQSVRELLMNVVKHANAGEATITVVQEDRQLCIQVEDHGAGCDVSAVASKVSSAWSSKFGLFSIRERMAALSGAFDLVSTPGSGTTATLTLPLEHRDENKQARVDLAAKVKPISHGRVSNITSGEIRVLLVDDHAMVRQGLRSVLEGYPDILVVGEASDGEEAIQEVEKLKPSVIVMDINMPRMNGIEATERIKSRYSNVIVIGLSVNSGQENQDAMRMAGASMLLTKEAAVEQLHGVIQDAVKASLR